MCMYVYIYILVQAGSQHKHASTILSKAQESDDSNVTSSHMSLMWQGNSTVSEEANNKPSSRWRSEEKSSNTGSFNLLNAFGATKSQTQTQGMGRSVGAAEDMSKPSRKTAPATSANIVPEDGDSSSSEDASSSSHVQDDSDSATSVARAAEKLGTQSANLGGSIISKARIFGETKIQTQTQTQGMGRVRRKLAAIESGMLASSSSSKEDPEIVSVKRAPASSRHMARARTLAAVKASAFVTGSPSPGVGAGSLVGMPSPHR
jgi:hypothetical protein